MIIFVDICSYLFICGDICWYLFIFIGIHSYLLYYSYVVTLIYFYWYLFIFVHIYSYVVIFVDISLYLLIFVHIGWYLLIAVDRFSLISDLCRYMLMLLRVCLMLSIPFIWIASGMHWQSFRESVGSSYIWAQGSGAALPVTLAMPSQFGVLLNANVSKKGWPPDLAHDAFYSSYNDL